MNDSSRSRPFQPTAGQRSDGESTAHAIAGSNQRIAALPRHQDPVPDDATFALCLTHDVDRPYKGVRSLYYATQERPRYHLRTAVSSENPYWQFEEIMALEDGLDVRSAFYFLNEQQLLARPVGDWFSLTHWVQQLSRYDITDEAIVDTIQTLEDGGWEVGLHGSYHSPTNQSRLATEKRILDSLLESSVCGGRQHYLRLSVPETWQYHRATGLEYDTSLGSATTCGFHAGYHPLQPFDDEFLVFPLTIMEQALPDPGAQFEAARQRCEQLLTEAAENDAVMTVLWHPRYFNEAEFPGYRALYRWLVERAVELGAWVGSPRDLTKSLAQTRDEQLSIAE